MRVTDQITGEHQAFTLTRQGVGLIFPLVPPRSGGTLIFGVTVGKSSIMAEESFKPSPLLPTFARADLSFERGEGPWLITDKGERYLDFGAGIAVNALGHAHPHLVEALTDQAQQGLARLQPLPHPGRRAAGAAARGQYLRRSRVLHQFRRRGARMRDQDGAQISFGQRSARALPHHHLRRRVPRPHAGDDRRRRAAEIPRGLRSEGRRLRSGPVRRPRGA